MEVGQALLVLLADGEQGSHVPDLVVDVVSASLGGPLGGPGPVKDHVGQDGGSEVEDGLRTYSSTFSVFIPESVSGEDDGRADPVCVSMATVDASAGRVPER